MTSLINGKDFNASTKDQKFVMLDLPNLGLKTGENNSEDIKFQFFNINDLPLFCFEPVNIDWPRFILRANHVRRVLISSR